MHKGLLFTIVIFLIAVLSIFFFGDFVGKKKIANKKNTSNEAGAMQEMHTDIHAITIEELTKESISKLNPEKKEKEKKLTQIVSKDTNAIALKDLAEFWEQEKNLNMAAFFYKKAAFLENTEKSITFAGNLYMAILQRSDEPSIRLWQANEAIECFNELLKRNPKSTDYKLALASCYTEGTGETMKGVALLREITADDSTNIPANMLLGRLSIQSGQFDKAQKRFELVLSIKPDNTEALYFLAETYKGLGQIEKSKELFEKCKKLINNPDFSKEIDAYIKTF